MALTVRREPDPGHLQPAQPLSPDYGPGSTPFGRMHIAAIQGATDATERQAQYMGNQVNYDRGVARQVVAQKFAKSEIQVRDRWAQWQTHFRREAMKLQGERLGIAARRMDQNYLWNMQQIQLGRKDLKLEKIGMIGNAAFAVMDIAITHAQERKREREDHQNEIIRRTAPEVARRIEVTRAESLEQMAQDIAGGMGPTEAQAAHRQRVEDASAEILREVTAGLPGTATTETAGKIKDYVTEINAELDAKDAVRAAQLGRQEHAARTNAQIKQEIISGGFEDGADYAARTDGLVKAGIISPAQQATNVIHAQRYDELERPLNEARAMMNTGKHAAARTILEEMVAANEKKYGTDSAPHQEAQKRAGGMMGEHARRATHKELDLQQPGPTRLNELLAAAHKRVTDSKTRLGKLEAIGQYTALEEYGERLGFTLKADNLRDMQALEQEIVDRGPGGIRSLNTELTDAITNQAGPVTIGGVTYDPEKQSDWRRLHVMHGHAAFRRYAGPTGPTDMEMLTQLVTAEAMAAWDDDGPAGIGRLLTEQQAYGQRSDADLAVHETTKTAMNKVLGRLGIDRKTAIEAYRGQAASGTAERLGSQSQSREDVSLGSRYDIDQAMKEYGGVAPFTQITQDTLRKYRKGADLGHLINRTGIRDALLSDATRSPDAYLAMRAMKDTDPVGFAKHMKRDEVLAAMYDSWEMHNHDEALALRAKVDAGELDKTAARTEAERLGRRARAYEETARKNEADAQLQERWKRTGLDQRVTAKNLITQSHDHDPEREPITPYDHLMAATIEEKEKANTRHQIDRLTVTGAALDVFNVEVEKAKRSIPGATEFTVYSKAARATMEQTVPVIVDEGHVRTWLSPSGTRYHGEVVLAPKIDPEAMGVWGREKMDAALLIGPFGSVEAMPRSQLHNDIANKARQFQHMDPVERRKAIASGRYGADWDQLNEVLDEGYELTAEPVVWLKLNGRDGTESAIPVLQYQRHFNLPAADSPQAAAQRGLDLIERSTAVTMDSFRVPLNAPVNTDAYYMAAGVEERAREAEEARIKSINRMAAPLPEPRR